MAPYTMGGGDVADSTLAVQLRPSTTFSDFSVYGPILIGTFIGIFGCGMVLLATMMYIDRYRQSSGFSKALLIFITALNIAQSGSDCSRVLKILVYHPNLVYFLNIKSRPEELLSPVLSIIICTIVQLFLVDRCLLFTRINQEPINRGSTRSRIVIWTIGTVLCLGVAVSFAGGLGTAIALHNLPSFIQAFRGFNPTGTFPTLATVWLSASAATDVLISGVIAYQLWVAIHDKMAARRNRMIRSMVTVVTHGGLLVTLLQIAILVTYFESNSAWSDFPSIFISKVYSLTLLATWILPRQTHPSSPARQKELQRAHPSIPFTLPRPIDPFQHERKPRTLGRLTVSEIASGKQYPPSLGTTGTTRERQSEEVRSPDTFGFGNEPTVGYNKGAKRDSRYSAKSMEDPDDSELKIHGSMEAWRHEATQYDEDGEKIPGVLDLVS